MLIKSLTLLSLTLTSLIFIIFNIKNQLKRIPHMYDIAYHLILIIPMSIAMCLILGKSNIYYKIKINFINKEIIYVTININIKL